VEVGCLAGISEEYASRFIFSICQHPNATFHNLGACEFLAPASERNYSFGIPYVIIDRFVTNSKLFRNLDDIAWKLAIIILSTNSKIL
jgi:hypothetical protein